MKARVTVMLKAGVLDPTKVVRTALTNAGSIAALMLTTEALIAEIPEGCQKKIKCVELRFHTYSGESSTAPCSGLAQYCRKRESGIRTAHPSSSEPT